MTGKTGILGIVNLSADSFWEGSRVGDARSLVAKVVQMLEEGADAIDLGAASSRPGTVLADAREQWALLKPALETLRKEFPGLRLSVDSCFAEVVRRCFDVWGPFTVNDISAGEMDPGMLPLVGSLGLPYIAMHMRGTPLTMSSLCSYDDVVKEVRDYFTRLAPRLENAGIKEWILDPGFGFAKTTEQNYRLLSALPELCSLGRPVLVGVSRKSMIYKPLGIGPEDALAPTQAVHMAALIGGAAWLRVHDVKEAVMTAKLYSMMYTSSPGAAKR
ncbi:MAG: dihydropteroate synthase [Bacteroidales bacterium]|nr:dihydropteroate synthase [Bacteroidales bacterium]